MLKNRHKWITGLIFAVLIFGPIYGALSSQNFQNCEQRQGQYPTKENEGNKASRILVPSPSELRILWQCSGGYANENGVAITALATILLTVVTGGLVLLGFEQSRTTRRQLRAYIFADDILLLDGATPLLIPNASTNGCPHSHIWIKNFGVTPAYEVKHFSRLIFTAIGPEKKLPPNTLTYPESGEWEQMPATVIGPSSKTNAERNLGRVLTPAEIQALAGAGYALVIYGRVSYRDTFGAKRKTDYAISYNGPYPAPTPCSVTYLPEGIDAD